MSLYFIKKERFSNHNKLFRQYLSLVKDNGSKVFYGLTVEDAKLSFDEKFLETLIFSEKLKAIMNKHKAEIEKEIKSIYPESKDSRERISSLCGRNQMIEVTFKQGLYSELDFNITGLA